MTSQAQSAAGRFLSSIWLRYLLAGASGLATALALPKLSWWPLALVGLVPLFSALEGAPFWRAFRLGQVAGTVHFLVMVSWLPRTMELYAGVHWSLCYLAPLILALFLGLYWALFAGCYALAVGRGIPGLLAAPVFFVAFEILRGAIFTGFAWMPLGNLLVGAQELIQAADFFGVYGLSLAAVFINYCLWAALVGRTRLRAFCFHLALAATVVVALLVYGLIRLPQIRTKIVASPRIFVSVLQGNIPPLMKHDRRPENIYRSIDTYGQLTRIVQADTAFLRQWIDQVSLLQPPLWAWGPHLIIWPETALVFPYATEVRNRWQERARPYSRRVLSWTRYENTWLVLGNVAVEVTGDLKKVKPWRDAVSVFNRATLVDPLGREAGHYDKVHLVPFGEYLPWPWLTGWLRNLSSNIGNFSPGQKGRLLQVYLVPVDVLAFVDRVLPDLIRRSVQARVLRAHRFGLGVLVCYESIFPDLARTQVARGAGLMINITNDAWFGRTSAPYQHQAHMILRAVENRRPVARAANTGFSSFIEPTGTLFNRTDLETVDARTTLIPVLAGRTVYTRFGHYLDWLCLVLALGMIIRMMVNRRHYVR
ncbi:MAG: apolipoprotein N-acyltransferase [Proteobacteria bacterium]|nr:apolipoprotein N-acyltransferase [Pseudomonadota bacterium]